MSSATISTPTATRTRVISILGVVVIAAGVLDVVTGLAAIAGVRTISIPRLLTLSIPVGYATYLETRWLIAGAVTVTAAVALLRLRPWAWEYAWIVMWMAILLSLADFVVLGISLEYTMLTIAVAAVIQVYLARPDVQRAFRRTAELDDDLDDL